LARLLKRTGTELATLNQQLREHQTELEHGIEERTRELQESQAQVLHQEKMAAFGLLAAGIAHEVGNPLTSISTLVQMLERLAPEHRDKLFRPYFTTKRHGTGLGLFVTQKLVHEHGGTVECESAPAAGTTFRLVFPLTPR